MSTIRSWLRLSNRLDTYGGMARNGCETREFAVLYAVRWRERIARVL